MSKASVDVQATASLGIAVNVAAGHVAEMTGNAVQAAASSVGCPVGAATGKAIATAGKAWATTAASSGARDAKTMGASG